MDRLTIIVAALCLAAADTAAACSRGHPDELMTIEPGWREAFADRFASAEAVYLVTVRPAAPLADGELPIACDQHPTIQPPLPRRAGQRERAAYAAAERDRDAARRACRAEQAQVTVVETLKGVSRTGWTEDFALVDVIDAAPTEPVEQRDSGPAYGAAVGNMSILFCDGWTSARRMSRHAAYLVFTGWRQQGDGPRLPYLRDAFWADPAAPFLEEARRLAAPAAKP
ncbi:hypothetical protein [Phenylobacterium sp.]|jgi:hypothetical protein|uniref:hypothetical protein n=1 Tax=Phenylobacterium sp. TaxID=1871053 RepID=UPI002F955AAD